MSEDPAERPGGTAQGLRGVFRNLGWLAGGNAFTAVLSLVYIGIAARTLGLADFGRFALITGAAQTGALLVSFETWKVVVRYGQRHDAAGDHAATAQLIKAAVLVEAGSAVVGMMLVGAMFAVWERPFGLTHEVAPYALGYAIVQLAALRQTPIGILRLRDRFDLATAAEAVQPVIRLGGALAALALGPSLPAFLLAWGIAELATVAAYWLLIARSGALGAIARAPVNPAEVQRRNPGIARLLLNTNLQGTLALATRQAPLLVVGGYAGPAAAGAFRLAVQLANALSKLSVLVTRAAFPEIVRSVRTASRDRLARGVRQMFLVCLGVAAIVMLVVALGGRQIMELVGGAAFGIGYVYLVWLAGAGSIDLATSLFEPVLLSAQRAATATLARASGVAVQFAMMLVLLPPYGALGASMSVFAGALVSSALLGLALLRYLARHGPEETPA